MNAKQLVSFIEKVKELVERKDNGKIYGWHARNLRKIAEIKSAMLSDRDFDDWVASLTIGHCSQYALRRAQAEFNERLVGARAKDKKAGAKALTSRF